MGRILSTLGLLSLSLKVAFIKYIASKLKSSIAMMETADTQQL